MYTRWIRTGSEPYLKSLKTVNKKLQTYSIFFKIFCNVKFISCYLKAALEEHIVHWGNLKLLLQSTDSAEIVLQTEGSTGSI